MDDTERRLALMMALGVLVVICYSGVCLLIVGAA